MQSYGGLYAEATPVRRSFAITKAPQAALVAVATPSSISPTGTSTLGTSGGSGTGAVSYSLTTGGTVCSLAGNVLSGSSAGAGTCIVTATKAGDALFEPASANVTVAVDFLPQAITFPVVAAQTYAPGRTVALAATASSNLPVSYASTATSVCTVSGNVATLVESGTCSITASQAGNASYAAATNVVQSFTVNKADQTALVATATPPAIQINGLSTLATSGGMGVGGVSYAITAGAASCSLAGSTVTGIAAGSCTVAATKAADAQYNAATANVTISVSKVPQTIVFGAPPAQTFTPGGTVALLATASSGLAVTFASNSAGVCTTGGTNGATVTIVAAGTCSIKASQAGNANYEPAPDVTQTFGIGKSAQTITFNAPPAQTYVPNATLTLAAAASSGLTVTFASKTAGVCTTGGTNGATVTIVSAGTCSITASQAGNANYEPAPDVTQSFAIDKAPQVITFTKPADQTYASGLTVPLVATGGASGNPVTFASTTTNVCHVTGAVAKITGIGTCSITASQAGNANYHAAADVVRSFAVKPALVSVELSASTASIVLGQPVELTATASTASAGVPVGQVTFSAGSTTLCANMTLSAGVAKCSARFTAAGTYEIVAAYAGSGVFAPALSKPVSVTAVDQTAKTTKVIGDFLASRTNQLLSNQLDTGRQIDRLNEAAGTGSSGQAGSGFNAEERRRSFANPNLADASRAGMGPSGGDATAMGLGLRSNPRASLAEMLDVTAQSGGSTMQLRHGTDSAHCHANTVSVSPVDDRCGSAGNGGSGQSGGFRFNGSFDNASRIGVSTSLRDLRRFQAEAEANKGGGGQFDLSAGRGNVGGLKSSPFDLWFQGQFSRFESKDRGADQDGHFGLLSFGADYVLHPGLLVGAMIQFDSAEQRSAKEASEISGRGWMAGPYAMLRLNQNVFWQVRAAWGQSANTISPFMTYSDSFDSTRWLASATLVGRWTRGAWTFQPSASVSYMQDAAGSYTDTFGAAIPSVQSKLGQAKVSPEVSYRMDLGDLVLEPRARADLIWNFAQDTRIRGGGPADGEYAGPEGVRGRLELGLSTTMPNGVALDVSGSYDGIGASTYSAVSGRGQIRVPLN